MWSYRLGEKLLRALVKEHPKPGLSLMTIEPPVLSNTRDVIFKVAYCSICAGDLKVYDWDPWAASDATLHLPTVLGHEVSGVVEEIGSEVKKFKPGDRISVDSFLHCALCNYCTSGFTNLCENREIYGKRRGAFAEYAVLPEHVLVKLPDSISTEEGALLENLGIAVHAVEQVPHYPGELAVVMGSGPIGNLAAQALTASGLKVLICDKVEKRLKSAQTNTSIIAVDIRKDNLGEIVHDLSSGRGADFILEAAGSEPALLQAFDLIKPRGTIVTIGTYGSPVTFNPFFQMTRKEVRLFSSIGRTAQTWRKMVLLLDSSNINLKGLISCLLPLEDYENGFELAKSKDVLKVLLKP
jgi:2-desacetyl-2-hydroxyethyl bacteriochlorophyllide A dehydrogenase